MMTTDRPERMLTISTADATLAVERGLYDGTFELTIDMPEYRQCAWIVLDAAWAGTLRDVCSRFLATQEGDDGTE